MVEIRTQSARVLLAAMPCCSCHALLPGLAGFWCVSPIKSVVLVLEKGLLKKKLSQLFKGVCRVEEFCERAAFLSGKKGRRPNKRQIKTLLPPNTEYSL